MGMELLILSLHSYGRNILVSKSWFGEPSEGLSFAVIGNSVLPELGNLAHSIAGSEVTNPRNVYEFGSGRHEPSLFGIECRRWYLQVWGIPPMGF